MKNNDPWGNDESRWKNPAYLQWLKEIWHVEIEEEARHLWPGQWTIHGYWEDEKKLYKKYESEWELRCQKAWDEKYPNGGPSLNLGLYSTQSEDYFHWNVETPGWSMHRDGSWQKMFIDMNDWKGKTRDQYPGIYNSYEHACKTLANNNKFAPRFAIGEFTDYEKHLKDFVDNYNYTVK